MRDVEVGKSGERGASFRKRPALTTKRVKYMGLRELDQRVHVLGDTAGLAAPPPPPATDGGFPDPYPREIASLDTGRGEAVTASPRMAAVFASARALGRNRSTVLLCGETGTGKEVVARAIHCHGAGAKEAGPFVPVNCAALSASLFESELFGHVKGAYTGAHVETLGFYRAADGGTLFLDEVLEIESDLQAKLLRVIEDKGVTPVGSDVPYPVDVRLIAATNRDLDKALADGSLRPDLFYRLNVVTLYLPPLRDRKEDIPLFVDHFLGKSAEEYGVERLGVSPAARRLMCEYAWPGNVRELRAAIERAYALGRGPAIAPSDLPRAVRGAEWGSDRDDVPDAVPTLEEVEARTIRMALTVAEGNKAKAADMLDIHRSKLYRKLRKHGID